MDIVFDSLLGSLLRSLEQGTHIDVEADIGITRCNDLGTAVVSVLTELGDHDTGLATLLLSEACAQLLGVFELRICFHFCTIYS